MSFLRMMQSLDLEMSTINLIWRKWNYPFQWNLLNFNNNFFFLNISENLIIFAICKLCDAQNETILHEIFLHQFIAFWRNLIHCPKRKLHRYIELYVGEQSIWDLKLLSDSEEWCACFLNWGINIFLFFNKIIWLNL